MDRERLGRALGYGARHAAKALTQAVDAATSPGPAGSAKPAPQTRLAPRAAADVRPGAAETRARVRGAAKMAGKTALAPVAKFSSVLWLQVTGSFFVLMAFAMGEAVWKAHGAIKLPSHSPERLKLYGYAALTALFVYFAVSNFARAGRRGRR